MEPSEAVFVEIVGHNPTVVELLRRAEALDLPGWYLTAGCLFQSVWNVLDGHDPERGIRDYDLNVSWDAEDEVIRCSTASQPPHAASGCGSRDLT